MENRDKLIHKVEQVEKQRTILQQRKISAALKLENANRGNHTVQTEFLEQLQEKVETADRELRNFEQNLQNRQQREMETLKRFGIEVPGIRVSSSVSDLTSIDASIDEDLTKKKRSAKPLQGFLEVPPLFRRRSGSDTSSRKYRAMSADVVALPTSSVRSLRLLYTGESQFLEEDVKPKSNRRTEVQMNREALQEIAAFEKLIENFFARRNC